MGYGDRKKGLDIRICGWRWGIGDLVLGIGHCDWELGLGLGLEIGIGEFDFGLEIGI